MTAAVGAEWHRNVAQSTIVLLVVAGAAWTSTIVWVAALDMTIEAGTMDLGVSTFIGMWTLMMTAMMLPAVSPLVSLYAKSVRGAVFPPAPPRVLPSTGSSSLPPGLQICSTGER